jgi:hypothetical protein
VWSDLALALALLAGGDLGAGFAAGALTGGAGDLTGEKVCEGMRKGAEGESPREANMRGEQGATQGHERGTIKKDTREAQ